MSLGQASGHAAAQAIRKKSSLKKIAIRELQHRLHQSGAATIYVSDVLPDHSEFAAVQWWGMQGGLHGLFPMPEKPGQRGRNIHGQYFEANPGHTADLDMAIDDKLMRRWKGIAILIGLDANQLDGIKSDATRGEFIRKVHSLSLTKGLVTSPAPIPKLHLAAMPNLHPPGEVDKIELLSRVITNARELPGIVMDDDEATLVGAWEYSTHTPPYVGRAYLHDRKEEKGSKSATYTPSIPREGKYEVRISHCYNVRRATNTVFIVKHADGETRHTIDQQQKPEHADLFRTLGTYRFEKGTSGSVQILNEGSPGKVAIADAVQFLPVE